MLGTELKRSRRETPPGSFFGEPFTALQRDMNELLEHFLRTNGGLRTTALAMPSLAPIDLCEDVECYHVTVDVPGFTEKDVSVTLENDSTLVITGKHEEEREEKGKTWLRRERSVGELHRTIALPMQVEPNKIEARLVDGILTIDAPKTRESLAKHRTIKVTST